MNIRVFVFSTIALAGVTGLLLTGVSGAGNERGDYDEHDGEVYEHEAVRDMAEQGDIELEEKGGELVYEVEILGDKGEVWEMKFDARSGALLEEEQED